MKNINRSFAVILTVLYAAVSLMAQGSYMKPPKDVLDVLDAAVTPSTYVSPAGDKIAMLTPVRYPSISELAEPMLRLAGLRINPNTNAQHRETNFVALGFKNVKDGKEIPVGLPRNAKLISPNWSPDGKYLAVGSLTPNGVDLLIVDSSTGKINEVKNAKVNTAFGEFDWISGTELTVTLVPIDRGVAPSYQNLTPSEPNIQETAGRTGAVQTFQDLLRSPNDEDLFEYFATSQLAIVKADGSVKKIGKPAMYNSFEVSPDGKYFLVAKTKRPFSYQYPYYRFPQSVEVWDSSAKLVYTVADIPLLDNLPVQGVTTKPRSYSWIPTEAATLIWAEALDGGDPKNKAEFRDKLVTMSAPFIGQPKELLKTQHRYSGRSFGEASGMMLYYDYDRDTRRRRIFMTDYRNAAQSKLISDLNTSDRYNDIGQPVMKTLSTGASVIRQNGNKVLLTGTGASVDGDRPFLRRFDLTTLKSEEIFRSDKEGYESIVSVLDNDGMNYITRRESTTEPPNLLMRQTCPPDKVCTALAYRQLTEFKDPSPQLRGVTKQLVRYKRNDGVDLSFTLYLPPGYKQGTPLPTIVWAYPLEFSNASVAGQVSGSTNRFTQIGGISHLFFALQGYAVLDATTMPIVGDPETVNDTFVKQIVDSAQAAIDKGVEMGVVDRNRVGVGGHSYGAFMTANLLAHSDIFRAGIARSGAYNRTLTPFGFQSERRTFWEAPELYAKVSPFFVANKINEPILLIHGEADNNQGTYPIQSERLYAAISGTGGTARLVMLPLESHGYSAKESVDHTLFEMISWFDKYVKNAKPKQ